ncbi:DNA-3-methyladenine glycosylase family protein [Sediminibacillus halophilus]|uniref:DNA-3-methyladenine glycosylase II n=1 Tax=Sediminibacillus halophilus TaxID=482461 RepID=A0A1G9VED7_9BACI|nr:DNA-3-methyladenine glycosylase [Sediminibacillus halophilus]SDM70499.1 DNA-3-methyladenine glycosylase II [Sediminibacillus halophilus]
MWKETITLDTMYDFDYSLQRLQMDPLLFVDRNQRSVDVPLKTEDGRRHKVTVRAKGNTPHPVFEVSGDHEDDKSELLKQTFDLFQWEKDLTIVNEHFTGTNLEQLFYAHPGTPIVRDFDLYFSLMKGIIHQQLNMKFAYTLSTRFVEAYGAFLDGVWFYPEPEDIAELPYEDLRRMQFSQRKAEYVIDTSKKIAEGEIDLTALAVQSDKHIIDQLVKIRGIGPWTAENWLLFGLGRDDLLPKADIGIQNALKFYFKMDKKPTIPEITEMSDGWSPYQSHASLTLWRSIEG